MAHSKASSSKAQASAKATENALGYSPVWYRPFLKFLDPLVASWPSDKKHKQDFLREKKIELIRFAERGVDRGSIVDCLPPDDKIKVAIAGYLTQRQAYIGNKEIRKGKPVAPKKTKAVYKSKDIVRELFKARILARSKEIAQTKGLKQTFLASREALTQIELELNPAEVLEVAKMTESWNSGEILDERARRLHTAAKLGRLTEDYLLEIKQKHSAHVVMMIGFPDEEGAPMLSLFESDPPESMEKFSKTPQWKACGFRETGFEEYIAQRWSTQQSSDVEGPTDDYKDLIWFAEVKDQANKMHRPAPMLTDYPAMWTQDKLRKAWRYYCSQVLCFQTNEEKAVIPWKKVEQNPKDYVESVAGIVIDWSDPSRLDAAELRANWVACVKNQETADDKGQRVGQMPFRFRRSITAGVSKTKDKYQLSLDADRVHKPTYVEVEDEDEEADNADAESNRERRISRATRKKQSGPEKKEKSSKRRKLEKSQDLDPTSEDEDSALPPTKKAKHQDSSDARGALGAEVETARLTQKDKGKKKAGDQDAVGSDVDFELLDDYIAGAPNLAEEHEDDTEDDTGPENFNLDNVRSESEADHEANASESSTSSIVAPPSVPPISTLGGPNTDEAQRKAAGKAQAKKAAGAAQPKQSGAAGAKSSGAAGAKQSGAAGAKSSGAAGAKQSGVAGTKPSGAAGAKQSGAAGAKSSGTASKAQAKKAAGKAQAKAAGTAQPKESGAAGSRPSGAAGAEPSGAAGAEPSGAAGTKPSPLETIWATEVYRAVQVEADSEFFIPAADYVPFEPEIFSPAAALSEKKQSIFLLGLNYREEFMDIVPHVDMSYVDQGAFLHNMPPYLRWWHPVYALPPIFHQMNLEKFNELLRFLLMAGTVSGHVSHPTLLALGLICRELENSNMFSPDPSLHPPVLTTDHFDAYVRGVKALRKSVVATAQINALTFPVPAVRTTDKLGYIIANPLPIANADHGSPLDAAGGSRSSAAKYISSLSVLEVFQHAVGIMNKGKIEKSPWSSGIVHSLSWLRPTYYSGAAIHGGKNNRFRQIIAEMVNCAKSGNENIILHTYVLAFGLAFRDISAAISTNRGTPANPPLPVISNLSISDQEFVIEQLVDLLKWAKHPVYEVQGQKRVTKAPERVGGR